MSLLNAKVLVSLSGTYQRPAGYGLKARTLDYSKVLLLGDGTGANNVDLLYETDPTTGLVVAPGSPVTIDLSGVAPDSIGDTLALVRIRAFWAYAWDSNVNDVLVGGAASNAVQLWNSGIAFSVPPGGDVLHTHPGTGWLVTPGTADQLKIANAAAGADVKLDLVIFGSSA
jgi:hypothetical protein